VPAKELTESNCHPK